MKFESGLEFGRNAAEINKAYAKMINESFPEPKPGSPDYISDEEFEHQRQIIQRRRARRGETSSPISSNGSTAQSKDTQDMEKLLFQAGKSADDFEGENDGFDEEMETEDNTIAEDNFFTNAIEANPDVFNDENYDMEALKAHKKEIMDKATENLLKAIPVVRSVEMALEEIPGCECKIVEKPMADDGSDSELNFETDEIDSDDLLGNIDNADNKPQSERNGFEPKSVDGSDDE